ncbi:uncharacterized protein A4U43_UnF1310 [Asparagus officinalis]|uniref:non-specific serine/threonine protein kinase n=1 Tax=Asparagus officinalis TaxID=4686 RepID=A0A1R3L7L0_ASPOF|nr:SNF1-related protein kinase catalytic subunit alpha KIN10-like [Asparagus officinalis]XP_020249685.1 SNF1-related protein kinase catalytic subunit alpha KIN10-like [Asparagus officinalis]XP_020249686.1 SNF1-related protein kinase catalytic subunit alpha KIN10-like [Asparagus officinalis]XP_020249687.1 SNF1-related protein kinase catalytic subunit alpha KIN10-like [Asparagus officinalis]ONK55597.1 uncharacterized protein A4U43_UnF1310 [Asparagus officinalis]
MEGHGRGSRVASVLLQRYRLERRLGIGSFSKVKSAVHILTGHRVAIKILNRRKMEKLEMEEKVCREIKILKLFMHPHIIRLYEVIETHSDIYLVMEYINSGELFDYIVEKGRLSDDEARRFFQQIISGVEYCHRNQVVHRDLKPENLLLDSNFNIKIADFGLSNVIRDGHFLKTSCGSPNYAAPEVISGKLYAGPEVDVWSCGVILYALLCGNLPFDDASIPNLFKKIKSGMYTLPSHLSPGARDLISRMLVVDPMKRATIPEIRQHPWFQVQLPRYLALPLPDTTQGVKKINEEILLEVVRLGFERNQLVGSLINRIQDEATVSYYLLLGYRLHTSNGYAGLEFQEAMDVSFSNTQPFATATSAFSHSVPRAVDDQGTSCRPNFPNGSKWTLGLQANARPCDIMKEVVGALHVLSVCWKNIGNYNMRCKWKPGLQSNSERCASNPLYFDHTLNNDFVIVEKNDVPADQFNTVKFEIQLYKNFDEKYLLDVQRVEGSQFLFLSLCSSLLHQLRVH